MKEIAERSRAAMNFVLIATLLLAWGAFRKSPDILEIAYGMLFTADRLAEQSGDSAVGAALRRFLHESGDTLGGRWPTEQGLRNLKLSSLEEIAYDLSHSSIAMVRARPSDSSWFVSIISAREDFLSGLRDTIFTDTQRLITVQDLADHLQIPGYQGTVRYVDSYSIEVILFYEDIRRILQVIESVGLQTGATLGDLDRASQPKLKVPIIEESLRPEVGTVLMGIALIGPMLLLVSLSFTALQMVRSYEEGVDGCGWVFLHANWLGFIIGVVWLFAPAITCIGAWIVSRFHAEMFLWLGLSLAVLATIVTRNLRLTRRKWFRRSTC